jgi:hypothetical protein
MSKKITALFHAWKNQATSRTKATCSPTPRRGREIEMSATTIKTSIGLRYWTNINPRLGSKDGWYQPS